MKRARTPEVKLGTVLQHGRAFEVWGPAEKLDSFTAQLAAQLDAPPGTPVFVRDPIGFTAEFTVRPLGGRDAQHR